MLVFWLKQIVVWLKIVKISMSCCLIKMSKLQLPAGENEKIAFEMKVKWNVCDFRAAFEEIFDYVIWFCVLKI
jgi:hypothetical protein